jgi:hypothetical protein
MVTFFDGDRHARDGALVPADWDGSRDERQ